MTARPEEFEGDNFLTIDSSGGLSEVDLHFLTAPGAYDWDNELARQRLQQLERSLPRAMGTDQISFLGKQMYRVAHQQNKAVNEDQGHKAGDKSELRFLYWLSDVTRGVDNETSKNVQKVLMQGRGLRGKAMATYIGFLNLVQH